MRTLGTRDLWSRTGRWRSRRRRSGRSGTTQRRWRRQRSKPPPNRNIQIRRCRRSGSRHGGRCPLRGRLRGWQGNRRNAGIGKAGIAGNDQDVTAIPARTVDAGRCRLRSRRHGDRRDVRKLLLRHTPKDVRPLPRSNSNACKQCDDSKREDHGDEALRRIFHEPIFLKRSGPCLQAGASVLGFTSREAARA